MAKATHLCPTDDSGVTPCCSRSVLELPRDHRITLNPDRVTCTTPPADVDLEAAIDRTLALAEGRFDRAIEELGGWPTLSTAQASRISGAVGEMFVLMRKATEKAARSIAAGLLAWADSRGGADRV